MNAIKVNEEYRLQKKLETIEIKRLRKIKETRSKRRKYRDEMKNKKQQKIEAYYESKKQKDIAKRIKLHETNAEKKKRELLWKKALKKHAKKEKSLAWYKNNACIDYQWCIRYEAQDKNWYVQTIDWQVRNRKDCDAWHIFAKSKYPHLIFHPYNCFPQSKRSNKELGQSDWVIFKDEAIRRIWEKEWDKLIVLSESKREKNRIRDKQYRKDKYTYRHKRRLKLKGET